jgi:hypothetical protein
MPGWFSCMLLKPWTDLNMSVRACQQRWCTRSFWSKSRSDICMSCTSMSALSMPSCTPWRHCSSQSSKTAKLLRHLNCSSKNNKTLVGWASRPPRICNLNARQLIYVTVGFNLNSNVKLNTCFTSLGE